MDQRDLAQKFKPVECSRLDDIKAALKPFFGSSGSREINLSCKIEWSAEGKSGIDQVQGTSADVSVRQLLMEGLEVVKKRSEAYGKMKDAKKAAEEAGVQLGLVEEVWDINKCRFSVDALIEKRLGGKRRGLRVFWKVEEGEFEFDPYTNKLFKIE